MLEKERIQNPFSNSNISLPSRTHNNNSAIQKSTFNTMNKNILRTILSILLGLVILFGAIQLSNRIIAAKEKPKTRVENTITKVYAQEVNNTDIPIIITEKGSLQALQKVELYSEVQGILQTGNALFKPGKHYSKGSTIFSIDDREFKASLIAQKSTLYNIITQIMPDLKLDYPNAFPQWQKYLTQFDIQSPSTPPLPAFTSDKEKYFINSKNIVTTYYTIKNLEERHKKYTIRAPFYAVVTEALVNPGTLVRPGQKLGTLLNPSAYELPLSVSESYTDFLTIGKKVQLHNLNRTQSWTGKIARINPVIDPATQGIQIYISVYGKGLKEGMFLEADIEGKSVQNGVEVPRKLLIDNSKLYRIEDSKLQLTDVDIAFFKERSAVVKNLQDGTVILQNAIPGAYEGMLVEIVE